ncbi:uncharacterized protein [Arachis hypogaea]|uniref:uncharacterized protein n=1 Tax=Arachis hypogaea TaxID=3818 RepID=UPI003B20FBF4
MIRIKVKELVARAHKKWNLTVTKAMTAKTKQEGLSQIQGAFREQYKRINDYCSELLRTNPGSTVILKVIRSLDFAQEIQNPNMMNYCVFQRLYVCFDACKKSFQYCRRFIGLDGCFLKIPQGGQLLTAIRKDPNDQILPIAYTKWQLIGIPCSHAISCITFKGLDLESYVDDCYKKEAYLKCYREVIHPVNGPDLWERSQYDDVMPPPYRKPSHRPVKKRKRRPADEENRSQNHLSRRGQVQRCSNCGVVGHKKSGYTKPKKRVYNIMF